MPGQFNPDKNLFSVAPVGQIVIIGRSVALRGGLSREYALNLATWLLIAANATPEEVKQGIQDAMISTPTPKSRPVVGLATVRTVPTLPPPRAEKPEEVSPEVAGQVTPFIGQIDPEEAEGIKTALNQQTGAKMSAPASLATSKIATIDVDSFANAWTEGGSNG